MNKKTGFVLVLYVRQNMCQSVVRPEVRQKSRVGGKSLPHSRLAGEASIFVYFIKCIIAKCIVEDNILHLKEQKL